MAHKSADYSKKAFIYYPTHQASHIAVKLLLAVLFAEAFALEGALALEAAAWLLFVLAALAQKLDQAGFLDLLLEPLLKAVVGFLSAFVGVDSHKAGAA